MPFPEVRGCPTSRQLSVRSSGSLRILQAAAAAIRPRGHGFDQAIDEAVLAEVQLHLAALPAPFRFAFPIGLRLLEWLGPAFARRRGRFSRLPTADARAVLERFQELGGLCAGLVLGLRALVFLAFYQHPAVLQSLGVDWEGRARDLTARRATLLAVPHPEGGE